MNYERASEVLGADVVFRIEQAIDHALVQSRRKAEPSGISAVEALLMSQLAAVIAASHRHEDGDAVAANAAGRLRELVEGAMAVCRLAAPPADDDTPALPSTVKLGN